MGAETLGVLVRYEGAHAGARAMAAAIRTRGPGTSKPCLLVGQGFRGLGF